MVLNTNTGGVKIPQLTNPGTAEDLASGKQLIDQNGNVLTGSAVIPKVFLYGNALGYNNASAWNELSGSEWEQYLTEGTASNWVYVDIFVTLHNSSAVTTRYFYGSYYSGYSRGWLNNFYGYRIDGMRNNSTFELDFGSYDTMKSLGKLPLIVHKDDGFTSLFAQYFYVITEE